MQPKNIEEIQKSFTVQAKGFENASMNFSKQEYLDYTLHAIQAKPTDKVLEAAAGTCVCGRAIAPFANQVVCVDATPAMLAIGEAEAKKQGLQNIQFVNGYVESLPFEDESFDIVMTRLAFHHFTEMEKTFMQMSRVLKKGGKLVIMDMEAAQEGLRDIEDRIETMRDFSHVKNRSSEEFLTLYQNHQFKITKQESTKIPVSLSAWMALTQTPEETQKEIVKLLTADLEKGTSTGFYPYLKDGQIYFDQRWLLMIGEKEYK